MSHFFLCCFGGVCLFFETLLSFIMEKIAQKVAVFGGSGEVGRRLVRELLNSEHISKVICFGRSENLPLVDGIEEQNKAKLEIKVVNYDNLEIDEDLKECGAGFCTLGTTRAKAGVEGFKKVDLTYVVNAATACRHNNVPHFGLLTAANAKKNSWFLYPKTKGLAEEMVTNLHFPSLSIFRPALIDVDRVESRFSEKILISVNHILPSFISRTISVSADSIARALARDFIKNDCLKEEAIREKQKEAESQIGTITTIGDGIELREYFNSDIHHLGDPEE
eukprot:GCRY01001199.1.p1 GENE.GCRY01001199.1~~GCRY01001199.1.p1  ORF type:complete len:279 (-),score=29.68 GCRY01001199.1:164-1000(-)